MALRDILAGETADHATAAAAAAQGRSLTGLSGRQTEIGDRFTNDQPLYGDRVAPAEPMTVGGARPPIDTISNADGDDPIFRRRPAQADRKERVPFGAQEQILAYPSRPGYRRYWFSDLPGRIVRAKEAGYSHVLEPDGSPVSRITDRADGRGRASYLMETPVEWYQQDMARQAADLDRRLHDIKTGKAGPGAEDGRYIPQSGITITGR